MKVEIQEMSDAPPNSIVKSSVVDHARSARTKHNQALKQYLASCRRERILWRRAETLRCEVERLEAELRLHAPGPIEPTSSSKRDELRKLKTQQSSFRDKHVSAAYEKEQLARECRRSRVELEYRAQKIRDSAERLKFQDESLQQRVEIHLDASGKTKNERSRNAMRTSIEFIERHEATSRGLAEAQARIQDFAHGADFSKPVYVQDSNTKHHLLPPGSEVASYPIQGEENTGCFRTRPGYAPTDVGVASPNVDARSNVLDAASRHQLKRRSYQRHRVIKSPSMLVSHSQAVTDNFTNPPFPIETRGGGLQFYIPKSEQAKLTEVTKCKRKIDSFSQTQKEVYARRLNQRARRAKQRP